MRVVLIGDLGSIQCWTIGGQFENPKAQAHLGLTQPGL